MLRVLSEIPLLLLPFILYAGFLFYMKRDLKERANWPYKSVLLLTIAGVIMVFISLFWFKDHGKLNTEYRPATFENGVFKPAEQVKRP